MQRAANKLGIALVLLLVGLLYYGCGEGDFMDENGQRYITDVEFSDGDVDATLSIDTNWDQDCNNDGNLTDPETFTETFANIEIIVEENAPGITMTGYKLTFKPLESTDDDNNIVFGPDLRTYTGTYDVAIPSNSTTSFWITIFEFDTKDFIDESITAYIIANGGGDPDFLEEYRYEITIKMSFMDEYLEPRDITIRRTLYVGRFNRC